MFETTFSVKVYGTIMTGTVTRRGWVADKATTRALAKLPADKAKRARMRIRKAAAQQLVEADNAAHEYALPAACLA